nr:ATP-binding protein [Spirosoma rhododendri]
MVGSDFRNRRLRQIDPNYEEYWYDIFGHTARTGEAQRLERYAAPDQRWYSFYISKVGDEASRHIAVIFQDITERKRAEDQQAFLFQFSDALRVQPTAETLANRALQLLADYLQLDRCYVGVYQLDQDRGEIPYQVGNDRVPPMPDAVRLSDFPDALRVTFDRTLVIEDVMTTAGLTEMDRQNIGALGLRALVASTLRMGANNPLWSIVAVSARPRSWKPHEIKLLEDVTERTWAALERVKAEEALRHSEAKYRYLADHLDQQVQQRTQELAATNEELAATNEELTASNEELESNNEEFIAINQELEETNGLLTRSNENLQTFAYVASHDLQEPLRKIRQFGDLLKTRYAESIGEELIYVERMQSAAERMSILIKDLLNFARISTRRDIDNPVSLPGVVADVLTTLELPIAELGTQIQVGRLPTVSGDAAQLNQLFQNLLSNALKFYRPGVAPSIVVSASLLPADQLPPGIKPGRDTGAYHRITVMDNGIGFDDKYADRIFQIFQRLHSKNQYTGTGIGLAICEKVVTNHGGTITATSQPGQGATFTIYLPA